VTEIKAQLAIIGIDSLDPNIIVKYRSHLPNLSRMVAQSPTFRSKSVFPVDTIPAWVSIYTGLLPVHHGLIYVYDVFDPHLSDLAKLDLTGFKGKTFWDYAGQEGCEVALVMPHLAYPAWSVNGIMVSRSPFEQRIDSLRTTRDISVYPEWVREKYALPDTLADVWGQFPGTKHLREWISFGSEVIEKEKSIGLQLFTHEKWDLFLIYFSILDMVQHRLWRFFDPNDPTYPGKSDYGRVIVDFYAVFDSLIGEFQNANGDATLIVMSDHGHHMRPIKTVNVNEYLRRCGYLMQKGKNSRLKRQLSRTLLGAASKFNIEHTLMKFMVRSKSMTRVGKSLYSSSGSIDRKRSVAFLSTFAGIKSYSFGGIEINSDALSDTEYTRVLAELETRLLELKTQHGDSAVVCTKRRDELCAEGSDTTMYPDLLFELKEDFGVGWELYSDLFGRAYDHNVASGGHGKVATFLITGAERATAKDDVSIVDTAPTILDLLGVNWRKFRFDGRSIFEP
jgi:predicted AlkP superfamily phosphohydrolase/phosphomutase